MTADWGEIAVSAHTMPGNGDQFLVDRMARSAAAVASYSAPRSSGLVHATSWLDPAIYGQAARFVTGTGPEQPGEGWPHGALVPQAHGTGHGTVASSRHTPAAPSTAGAQLAVQGASPSGGSLPGRQPAEPATQHSRTAVRPGKKARRRLRKLAEMNSTSAQLAIQGRQPAEPATQYPSTAGRHGKKARWTNARKRLGKLAETNNTSAQPAVQTSPPGGGPLPAWQRAGPETPHPSMAGKATGLSRNARKRLLRRSTGTNSTTVQLAVQGAPLGGGPLPCRHLAEPATPYPSTAGRAGKKKARRRLRELALANTTSVQPVAAPPGVGPLRGWQPDEPETQHPSTAVQAEPQARRPCEQQRANQCANTEIPPADAPAPPADGPARDDDGEASGTRAAKREHPGSRPVTRASSAAAAAAAAAAAGPVATATPPTPTQSHAAASTAAPAAPAGATPTPGPQPGDRNLQAPSPRKRKRGCSGAASAAEPQPDSGDVTHGLTRAPEPRPGPEVYAVYRVLGRYGYKYLVQWEVDGSVGLVTKSDVIDKEEFDSRESHKGLDEGVDVLRKRARKTGEYQYQIQWPGSEQSVDGYAERRWVAARCIAEERREQELPSIAPKCKLPRDARPRTAPSASS